MKKNVKIETAAQPQSTASVVDGKLILSLPDAQTPCVWQMDLEEAKSSALEVIEDKKKKQFILNLKKADSDSAQIAPFENKEDAVAALMSASGALASAHGKIRPGMTQPAQDGPMIMAAAERNNTQQPQRRGSVLKGAILAAFLIILLLVFWTISISLKSTNMAPTGSSASSAAAGQSAMEAGVPLSAEDFLRNR
jgi:hypothetical protein